MTAMGEAGKTIGTAGGSSNHMQTHNNAVLDDHGLQIDVRALIAGKNPAAAAMIPGFLIRGLERILHVREINQVLRDAVNLRGLDFIGHVLDYFEVKMEIIGAENLVGLKRPVLVSNHPLGGMDGMVLLHCLGSHYPELRLMVNDFLMAIPNLNDLFVGVNKLGSNRGYQDDYRRLYASDAAILHFPAGLCSRKRGDKIRDLTWNRSYVRMSRDTHRPVIPAFFDGQNRPFFYNLARVRGFLGIGFNIEMILLADEMFRQRGKTLRTVIGEPIMPRELAQGSPDFWNDEIRRKAYALEERLPQGLEI